MVKASAKHYFANAGLKRPSDSVRNDYFKDFILQELHTKTFRGLFQEVGLDLEMFMGICAVQVMDL